MGNEGRLRSKTKRDLTERFLAGSRDIRLAAAFSVSVAVSAAVSVAVSSFLRRAPMVSAGRLLESGDLASGPLAIGVSAVTASVMLSSFWTASTLPIGSVGRSSISFLVSRVSRLRRLCEQY